MRPDSVAWERAAEVREAAQGWRQVGAIDASTHDAIRNAYPDPCVTPSPIWRALTASLVTAIMLCTLAALYAAVEPGETGLSLLLFLLAAAALVATERLESSPRLARRGAAGATSFWGIVFLLAGFALFLRDTMMMSEERALGAALLASTVAWGTGCWRWGNSLFAAGSAFSLFLFLARLPQGRVLWVLAGAALAGLAARRLDHGSSAPSHRHSAAVLVLAGISATYVALNVYSLDEQLLEGLRGLAPARTPPPPGLFALSAVATAVVPLGVLVWAWRSRRMVLLDAGIVLLGLSLVTLRHYIHVAPVWLILTVSGAVVIVLARAVERALRDAPDRERAGFTVDPLFSDERRQQMLQTVPVVATVTPSAVTPVAAEKGFAGSGGTFGGGGAGEKF